MPEPEKLERLPPVMETSSTVKSVDDSESVNVSDAVSLASKEVVSELIAMVGGVLSIVIAMVCITSTLR